MYFLGHGYYIVTRILSKRVHFIPGFVKGGLIDSVYKVNGFRNIISAVSYPKKPNYISVLEVTGV